MNSKQSLGYFAGLLLLLVGVGGYLVWRVFQDTDKMPELLMGVFVVTAIAALMTLLYLLAAGFKFMELTDPKQPLGLPDGSIRAMIALILIIAFIIFGFYLYRSVGDGTSIVLEKNISADSLRTMNMNRYKDLPTQIVATSDSTFSIQTVQKTNEEGNKLAQQLLTTVGTLVVAISSFYFGSNTVSSAVRAAGGGLSPETDSAKVPVPPTNLSSNEPIAKKADEDDEDKKETKPGEDDAWLLENKGRDKKTSERSGDDDRLSLATATS
jgi:hypothetical protein